MLSHIKMQILCRIKGQNSPERQRCLRRFELFFPTPPAYWESIARRASHIPTLPPRQHQERLRMPWPRVGEEFAWPQIRESVLRTPCRVYSHASCGHCYFMPGVPSTFVGT